MTCYNFDGLSIIYFFLFITNQQLLITHICCFFVLIMAFRSFVNCDNRLSFDLFFFIFLFIVSLIGCVLSFDLLCSLLFFI